MMFKKYLPFFLSILLIAVLSGGCQIGKDENQMTKLSAEYTVENKSAPDEEPVEAPVPEQEEQAKSRTDNRTDSQGKNDKEKSKKKKESKDSEKQSKTGINKNKAAKDQKSKEKETRSVQKKKDSKQKQTKRTTEPQSPKDSENKELQKESCFISIECSSILEHRDLLKEKKKDFVPKSGWILKRTEVEFEDGDSVYDVLYRICRKKEIHIEAKYTPAYQTYYVEGIHQLYEFDCGNLSGWTYLVNGKQPNYGCSKYKVSAGDEIKWSYTCDAGKDVMKE